MFRNIKQTTGMKPENRKYIENASCLFFHTSKKAPYPSMIEDNILLTSPEISWPYRYLRPSHPGQSRHYNHQYQPSPTHQDSLPQPHEEKSQQLLTTSVSKNLWKMFNISIKYFCLEKKKS